MQILNHHAAAGRAAGKEESHFEHQNHCGQHLRSVRSAAPAVEHQPDPHAHPHGRGKLSGRRYHPPRRCIRPCPERRQNAQIRRPQSGGAPFARDYDAVIHINVGSKFSSCFQNARLAAQEFGNVYVVDSENICTGQGYLVLQAAKWAADGLPPKNISMRLQGLAKRVELSFVLNQLDYMAKSGRCSGVLAFGANILGIKPSLAVIDGELKVVRKYRGSLPICVDKYITDQLASREDIDRSMVFISSTQAKPGCMEAIKAGLRQYGNFENVYETDIGTTIGGYSGPGTIGIVFARKQ